MNHEHDEYTDRLLYENPAIPTDEFLQILFERSLQELEELEKAERKPPIDWAEEKRKVEKAKKAGPELGQAWIEQKVYELVSKQSFKPTEARQSQIDWIAAKYNIQLLK